MRKVIFESSISSDGFIEGPNGELNWLCPHARPASLRGFLSLFDTIFYGRRTYEKLGMVKLPEEINGIDKEVAYAVLRMRKYVFSRTQTHVQGNGMVVREDLEPEVKRIREEEGKNIWLCAGPDLLKAFAVLDLVDDYLLSVHPIALRSGKPLFEGRKMPDGLRLVEDHKLKSGVIVMHYRPESRINRHYDGRGI